MSHPYRSPDGGPATGASTIVGMHPPVDGDTWVALTDEVLPVGAVGDWAVRPDCGGMVLFSGTVRDHAEGRPGVTRLVYPGTRHELHNEPVAAQEIGDIVSWVRDKVSHRRVPLASPMGS